MFAPYEHEPDTQEVIGNDPANRRKYVAQRIMYSVEIIFKGIQCGKIDTEYFECADFHGRTQAAGNYKE